MSVFIYLLYSSNKNRAELTNRLFLLQKEIRDITYISDSCMDKNSPKYKEVRNKSISLQKDIYDFDKKFLSGDTKDLQNTIDFIIDRYSVKSDCNYSCADYYATFEVDECKSTLYRNNLELC